MRIKPRVKVFAGRIDLVPLLNVIFLLLFFFVLSSSLVFQPGIPVELPPALTSAMNTAEKLVITVTRANLLFFNDKPVQWEELEKELRDLVLNSKLVMTKGGVAMTNASARAAPLRTPLIILRADKDASYAKVIEIMALARSLNLGICLATDYTMNRVEKRPSLGHRMME